MIKIKDILEWFGLLIVLTIIFCGSFAIFIRKYEVRHNLRKTVEAKFVPIETLTEDTLNLEKYDKEF